MLLSQRPLSAAAVDRPLVINSRLALAERIVRHLTRGRNVLVMGERGSGRTSQLSLIETMLRDAGSPRLVVRIDAEACADLDELLPVLLAAVGADPRGPIVESVPQFVVPSTARNIVHPRPLNETDVHQFVRAAQQYVDHDDRAVMLIDNLRAEAASDLFGRYRDVLWRAPIVWAAAGDSTSDHYLNPPADVFWEAVEWLTPLDDSDVRDLLERRINAAGPDDGDARAVAAHLDEIIELLDDATPRDVVRTAARVVDTAGGLAAARSNAELIEKAHQAGGRRAATLLSELQQLGRPAHANDAELRQRMGLTRPRIVQLLRSLEDADLVIRHPDGRRILFEANTPKASS